MTTKETLKGFNLEIHRQEADPAASESIKTGACCGNAAKFTFLDQAEKASAALCNSSALQQLLGKTKAHLHNCGKWPVFDVVTVPQQGAFPQEETIFSTNLARDWARGTILPLSRPILPSSIQAQCQSFIKSLPLHHPLLVCLSSWFEGGEKTQFKFQQFHNGNKEVVQPFAQPSNATNFSGQVVHQTIYGEAVPLQPFSGQVPQPIHEVVPLSTSGQAFAFHLFYEVVPRPTGEAVPLQLCNGQD